MKHVALLVLSLFSVGAMAAKTENFRMYSQPDAKPNRNCDIHTNLHIEYGKDGIMATMKEVVGGICQIFVEPNERTYAAPVQQDECGATVYAYLARGTGQPIFKLVDNRTMTCDKVVPAMIVVTESDENGNTVTLYSKDR